MKKLNRLLLFFFVLNNVQLVAQICPDFFIYNHFYIDGSYETCNRDFSIHTDLSIHFPEYTKTTIDEPGGPFPSSADWFIEADLDDGMGQVPLPPDKVIATTYPSAGEKSIQHTSELGSGNNSELFSIEIKEENAPYESPDIIGELETTMPFVPPLNQYPTSSPYGGSSMAKGNAYIKLADGHQQLTRPIIFVEGLGFRAKNMRNQGRNN